MILNSQQLVEKGIVITRDKGAPAQVGYDLTLQSIKKVKGGYITTDKTVIAPYEELAPAPMDGIGEEVFYLTPGTYAVTFEQGIALPNGHTAFVIQRSSLKRIGGNIQSPVFDPGFECENIGTILRVDCPLSIEKGARIAQLMVHESHDGLLYDGQFQREKDVK